MFPYDPALLKIVQTTPQSVSEVLGILGAIGAICVDADGLKWFNELYTEVTRAVKARVDARPKTIFFQKVERGDTSFYLFGWGGGTTDAQGLLDPIVHSPEARTKKGEYNYGKAGDAEVDRLIDAAGSEMNADKRARLIAEAVKPV